MKSGLAGLFTINFGVQQYDIWEFNGILREVEVEVEGRGGNNKEWCVIVVCENKSLFDSLSQSCICVSLSPCPFQLMGEILTRKRQEEI